MSTRSQFGNRIMPVPATAKAEAPLVEIFSSLQGEGILVGRRQVFIRFSGCHLNCAYCDTDFSASDQCKVERTPGAGDFELLPNPVALEPVVALIQAWKMAAPQAHHSISLTGGEPLLHADTLSLWLPELRQLLPIYLETSGTLPAQLESLLPHIDWISMDIKLPSLTGVATDWLAQKDFLQLATQTGCYVKIVVAETTPGEELLQAVELINSIDETLPLVLQPVTVAEKVAVSTSRLLEFQALIAACHSDVSVIPQTHRFLGVL